MSRRASAPPTASTTTRCSAPATASPSTRCRGRVPLRGFYPATIAYSNSAAGFNYIGSLEQGIPPIAIPDLSSGTVPLPNGVDMRTPDPDDVDRALLHQWNVTLERRLPLDLVTSVAYVGTQTNGGYAYINSELRRARHGQRRAPVLRAGGQRRDPGLGHWTTSKYHSLQVALNRPFKNGLMLKGAYTWSKAMNMADEDGWTGLTWNIPSQYDRNYARGRLRPYARAADGLRLRTALDARKNEHPRLGGQGLAGERHLLGVLGHALHHRRQQRAAARAGRRVHHRQPDRRHQLHQRPEPRREVDRHERLVQPDGLQWGNSGRNAFRGPSVYNLDFSLFRNIPIGRYRVEFRAQASNVLNHTRYLSRRHTRPQQPDVHAVRVGSGSYDAPRVVQLGLRFQFSGGRAASPDQRNGGSRATRLPPVLSQGPPGTQELRAQARHDRKRPRGAATGTEPESVAQRRSVLSGAPPDAPADSPAQRRRSSRPESVRTATPGQAVRSHNAAVDQNAVAASGTNRARSAAHASIEGVRLT